MHTTPASGQLTLPKSATGITGFDQITEGGVPGGRPTLICGGPGCGKTLFALSFLVNGCRQFDEPGVFVTFEETPADLIVNTTSLGFEVDELVRKGKLWIDHVKIERHQIEEAGEYDLDGLFVRIAYAIDQVGARRVALDTLEALFSGFANPAVLRAELRRLFGWLKDRGVTAVITAESGERTITRYGLEEYVSDCVIALDNRIVNEVATRRLRIVKYRGARHGTNEFPFLIDDAGFVVLPITMVGLDYEVSTERISTGVAGLDEMLGGQGVYRGSSILISGSAGSGKTNLALHFVQAAAARGERSLVISFEESADQIVRDARSIGIDLTAAEQAGLLHFVSARPTLYGVEVHLATLLHELDKFEPRLVVLDPVTALLGNTSRGDVSLMTVRLIDAMKQRGITNILTALTLNNSLETSDAGLSSIMDTWLLLRTVELNGERNRLLFVIKARGMAHSNQVREFLITDGGIRLVPPYLGDEGVLTGSARVAQENRARQAEAVRLNELGLRRSQLETRRALLAAQISALQAELQEQLSQIELLTISEQQRSLLREQAERNLAGSRGKGGERLFVAAGNGNPIGGV